MSTQPSSKREARRVHEAQKHSVRFPIIFEGEGVGD